MSGDDTNPQQQQRYPCPVCGNTFTRPQHVVRHLRSHTGERPYKCKECGDAFARSDLLSRHVNKCHPALANSGPPQSGKHPKRRACENCAHTGSRCDSNTPCASCVEQDVSCSRMPKSIGHHHTSIPSYSDSRPGLPYLNSTAPNFSGHRRNISGSDWSSDSSSRSRSSQYSQPATGEFGFDGTTLDSLPVPRGLPAPSGLPLPWAPGTPGNQNLDQSTITPNQVRALYGGSLPAGYTHPSQFPPMAGGINLPNPASLTSSNAPDPYNSFNPTMSYGSTQRSSTSSGTGQPTFGPASSVSHHLPPSTGWKGYTGQGQQQQQQPLYGSHPLASSQDVPVSTGGSNTYSYDPMVDFTSQSVHGVPQEAYATNQHQPGAGGGAEPGANNASPPSGNNNYTSSSSSTTGTGTTGPNQTRPSLPGLESFINATFPPLNMNIAGSITSPSTLTTNPGTAYFYGRGADRRGSVASSGSAVSDSASTPSSLIFQPPSPSDGSRPTTSSSSSVAYGPLPSAFGGLQLRGNTGGNVDCNSSAAPSSGQAEADGGRSGGDSGTEVGGANEVERNRRLWNSWLTTPLSAPSEKDAFVMSNGVLTPLNYPPAAGTRAGNNSGDITGSNTTLSAVPPHIYSSGALSNKHGQRDQQQQLPSSLQKCMSLPVIRTPNAERRTIGDIPTPRVQHVQAYNVPNTEDLRRYQEACLARETPSLTLAPRVRGPHTPGTDSNTDEGSNSPSPTSMGSSGGGSAHGHAQAGGCNAFHLVTSPTSRSGSSQSGGSGENYGQRGTSTMWQHYGPPAMAEPEPRVAKLNMNLAGQIGQAYSSQARPSFKRLASQTLGPELAKRAAVSGGGNDGRDANGMGDYDDGGDDSGHEYEIPDPPPIPRKRSNSSPTSSNSRPPNTYNSVGFQALPPFSSASGSGTYNGASYNSHIQIAR